MSRWASPSVSRVCPRTEWCTPYSGHGDERWLYACYRHPTNRRECWWYSSRSRWSLYCRIDRGICEGKEIRMFSTRQHWSMFTRWSTVANGDSVALRLVLHCGHGFVWPWGIDIELRDFDFVPEISTTKKMMISLRETRVSLPSSSFLRHKSRNMFGQRQRSTSTTLCRHGFPSMSSIRLRTVFIFDDAGIFQITEDTLKSRWNQRMSNSNETIDSRSKFTLEIPPECFQIIHGKRVDTLFDIESLDVSFGCGIRGEDRIQLRFQFMMVLLERATMKRGSARVKGRYFGQMLCSEKHCCFQGNARDVSRDEDRGFHGNESKTVNIHLRVFSALHIRESVEDTIEPEALKQTKDPFRRISDHWHTLDNISDDK